MAGRRVEDTAANVQFASVPAVLGVLHGPQDVHVHVGAAVAEHVEKDGVLLEVHVEDEFEDFLAQQLHLAALPEEVLHGGSVAHGD